MKHEALYYSVENGRIRCLLCPHRCSIKDNELGFCLARRREGNKLFSENYGILTALNLDPVEKKPLYMYKPKSKILSAGSFGCNFKCGFCQNSGISQHYLPGEYTSPEKLAEMAYGLRSSGNIGIAYTYNEPTVMYEYVLDTAKLLKERYSMDNILVTNGYINEEPLRELLVYVDAANVDFKSFDPGFYKKQCKGSIEDVKRNLVIFNENCHLEVTTLLIGGYNDSPREIEQISRFIASVSEDIPFHISRFYPSYLFKNEHPTPLDVMYEAERIALRYLKNVFLGNMP